MPKEGFITESRPDYHYGDESKSFIPWKDSTVEKPTKSRNKSTKPRKPTKCSICGVVGHNKRKCPENPENSDKDLTVCQPCTDDSTSVESLTESEIAAAGVGLVIPLDQLFGAEGNPAGFADGAGDAESTG